MLLFVTRLKVPPQTPQSGKSTPTDSESVFTDDEEWMPTPTGSTNGGNGSKLQIKLCIFV